MIRTIDISPKVLIAAFAMLAATAAFCSRAADSVTVHRQVSAAGLDLNTSEGAGTLYVRLKSAARSMCNPTNTLYAAPSWVYRDCVEDALAKAVRGVNRPLLAQMFVGDYGAKVAGQFGIDDVTHLAKK